MSGVNTISLIKVSKIKSTIIWQSRRKLENYNTIALRHISIYFHSTRQISSRWPFETQSEATFICTLAISFHRLRVFSVHFESSKEIRERLCRHKNSRNPIRARAVGDAGNRAACRRWVRKEYKGNFPRREPRIGPSENYSLLWSRGLNERNFIRTRLSQLAEVSEVIKDGSNFQTGCGRCARTQMTSLVNFFRGRRRLFEGGCNLYGADRLKCN